MFPHPDVVTHDDDDVGLLPESAARAGDAANASNPPAASAIEIQPSRSSSPSTVVFRWN
jgi:hypothetical protein